METIKKLLDDFWSNKIDDDDFITKTCEMLESLLHGESWANKKTCDWMAGYEQAISDAQRLLKGEA